MSSVSPTDPVLTEIENTLQACVVSDVDLHRVLDRILARFACVAGTIHLLNPMSGLLELRAQRGLPPIVIERTREVPIGKGMAGLAAERREPMQICNLQTDQSNVARPVAKETKMAGSIALPMLVGDSLRGTIGVAKSYEYAFPEAEIDLLLQIGTLIGKHQT